MRSSAIRAVSKLCSWPGFHKTTLDLKNQSPSLVFTFQSLPETTVVNSQNPVRIAITTLPSVMFQLSA